MYTRSSLSAPLRLDLGVAQLFVDDYLIANKIGVTRTLHQPKKDNAGEFPVIELTDEFGEHPATLEANGSIVYDLKLGKYVMFAVGFAATIPTGDRIRLYRFTSEDGIKWIRGDDGEPEWIQFDMNDDAGGQSASNHDVFCCYYDINDAEYPYKGWLYLISVGNEFEGIYYVRSRDGKKWERLQKIANGYCAGDDPKCRIIESKGFTLVGPGDTSRFYHDEKTGQFLGMFKFITTCDTPVGLGNRCRSRAFAFLDRADQPFDLKLIEKVDLVPAESQKDGDMLYDEYYDSTAWRCGSLWLGGLKVWHGGGDYPYSAAGSAFLKLIVSRDGLNWSKVRLMNDSGQPEVFIANGSEGGNGGRNDGGYISEFSQGPIKIGDELIYYYGASSYGKNQPRGVRVTGGGIFRARLRVDGYVSVDSGSLTTWMIDTDAEELFVNSSGPVIVEVLDEDGKKLAGAEVTGDSISSRICFNGKALADITGKRPFALRFSIGSEGRLYSFTLE